MPAAATSTPTAIVTAAKTNIEENFHDQKKIYPMSPRHKAQTKIERALFVFIKLLLYKCRIDADPEHMFDFNRLFDQKMPLLKNSNEQVMNDLYRRNAIAEIVWARKAAGFESVNEAAM